VLALLLFGGETLKAFAFALLVGTISGTYSSVFIAGPVLTAWKEREPLYRRRRASIAAENNGVVPAFATASAAMDVAPKQRVRRRDRLTAPDDPEMQVSREEFDELVRDLHVDPPAGKSGATATKPKVTPKPKPKPPELDPAADALPEDVVMPDRPDPGAAGKPKRTSAAAKRRSKHGRPR
jgi:SecD/SecF fusion protein